MTIGDAFGILKAIRGSLFPKTAITRLRIICQAPMRERHLDGSTGRQMCTVIVSNIGEHPTRVQSIAICSYGLRAWVKHYLGAKRRKANRVIFNPLAIHQHTIKTGEEMLRFPDQREHLFR